MNEAMGPNSRVCSVCAKIFEKPPEGKFDICPTCREKLAPPKDQQPFHPSKKPGAMLRILVVVGVVLTISQISRIRAAIALLFPPSPMDISILANPKDLCVANLWRISSLMQTDQWRNEGLFCPLTREPYKTTDAENGDTVVSCPNPPNHGLKTLRVSKNVPTPEVVQ